MNKVFLSLAVAALAIMPAAMAFSADMDTLPPPPPPMHAATYDWTGAYVGGWLGLACLDGRGSLTDHSSGGQVWSNGGCGFKGGGLAGYNFQMDQFVFGAEADLGTSSDIVRNTESISVGGSSAAADFRFNMDYLATLRARVGFAADNTLLYLTAGGAYARGELNGIVSSSPRNLTADQFGWTVGAGMEHAVSDHLRARLEYLYTQFPITNYHSCAASCNVDWNWGGEHEVKAAAIYAF